MIRSERFWQFLQQRLSKITRARLAVLFIIVEGFVTLAMTDDEFARIDTNWRYRLHV